MKEKVKFVKADFGRGEQGFNFFIGTGDYEKRIKEIIVPEKIFEKIQGKTKELNLPKLSKIDYYSGAHFNTAQLESLILECDKLEKAFDEKQVLRYIGYIRTLCKEAIQKNINLHIIGL